MLQGVNTITQKCQPSVTPNFLQGVNRTARKRHPKCAPSGKGQVVIAEMPLKPQPFPTSFIWCQLRIAAMPIEQRAKGRAMWGAQKCQLPRALPTQFNGVIVKTQKCLDIVAPRGEPSKVRRDVSIVPLSPTSLTGTLT